DKNEVISDLKTDYNRVCSENKELISKNKANEDLIKTLKAENEKLKSDNEYLKKDNGELKQKSMLFFFNKT
ncbi:hypothetical protein BCR36DRAFT_309957, partial [Piromyces finnis]